MKPILRLHVPHAAYAAGERVHCEVVLENPSPAALRVPDLTRGATDALRFELRGPQVALAGAAQAGATAGAGATFSLASGPANAPSRELGPRSDLSRGFTINDLIDASAPGVYALTATLDTSEGVVISEPVRWTQDAPSPLSIALPVWRGAESASLMPCSYLVQGEHLTALYRDTLGWDDEQPRCPVFDGEGERIVELQTGARELAAAESAEPGPPLASRWLAWLSPQGLHAGVVNFGFNQTMLALAEEPRAIVRNVLARGDGGCDVALLGGDGATLTLVAVAPPVVPPRPERPAGATEARPGAEGSDPLPPEGDDEEAPQDDRPVARAMDRVAMLPPRILWSHRLPHVPHAIALSRARPQAADGDTSAEPPGQRTAVAFVVQRPEGVEIFLGFAAGEDPPAAYDSILIPDADVLPQTRLALALDRRGNGHVAALALARGQRRNVVLGRVAFDRSGRPRIDQSAIYHDLPAVEGDPVAAGVSFFIPPDGPWSLDWMVVMDDGRCMVSHRFQPPRTIRPQARPAAPLEMMSFPFHFFVAATDGRGGKTFIDCNR